LFMHRTMLMVLSIQWRWHRELVWIVHNGNDYRASRMDIRIRMGLRAGRERYAYVPTVGYA
jgi:hypothetical protein